MKIIRGAVSEVSRLASLEEKLGSENIYQTYDAKTDEHHTIEFTTDRERLWVKRVFRNNGRFRGFQTEN